MPSSLYPRPGDLIQFQKELYTHWAVLVRDKYIIHVQAPEGDGKAGEVIIRKQSLDDYLRAARLENISYELWIDVDKYRMGAKQVQQCWASVNNSFDNIKKPFNVDEIIKRAESMIGTKWSYNLFSHNCEHFAHWCRYGVKVCKQSPNTTQYEDENGYKFESARIGGTNFGPIDFKVPSSATITETGDGRIEHRANGELFSLGIANMARASVGADGRAAGYRDDNGIGFKAEVKFGEADLGPLNYKLGISVSTGIDTKEGLKVEVLGTGFDANSDRLEVKILGNSVALTYPWKWFG
ncbi:unnamed protein product [Auanema sp. JU1783]|nr:unnamed protein product [Auanema sp. JU1783]